MASKDRLLRFAAPKSTLPFQGKKTSLINGPLDSNGLLDILIRWLPVCNWTFPGLEGISLLCLKQLGLKCASWLTVTVCSSKLKFEYRWERRRLAFQSRPSPSFCWIGHSSVVSVKRQILAWFEQPLVTFLLFLALLGWFLRLVA